jgi:hypothetical protein
MLKHACVTLQRPPPLTLTLFNNLPDFSTSTTLRCGSWDAAFTAQKNPAAPPPITINVFFTAARYWKRIIRHQMTASKKNGTEKIRKTTFWFMSQILREEDITN